MHLSAYCVFIHPGVDPGAAASSWSKRPDHRGNVDLVCPVPVEDSFPTASAMRKLGSRWKEAVSPWSALDPLIGGMLWGAGRPGEDPVRCGCRLCCCVTPDRRRPGFELTAVFQKKSFKGV